MGAAHSDSSRTANNMKKSIKALAAQHKRVEAKRDKLRNKAHELGAELNEAFGERKIYASSSETPLEETAPGEGTYGRLCYDGEEIRALYRTTDEDLEDDALGVPVEERSYKSRPLSVCSEEWLERLLVPKILDSLIANLAAVLDGREGAVDQSLETLDKFLAAESAEIEAQMSRSLEQAGSITLDANWAAVQSATHLETADGLARSSRMLESVCATILMNRGVELPSDKSMSPLVRATLKSLDWPSAKEAQDDVKQLLAGVQSIANAVGALRTHFSTAHGASSHLPPLGPEFASLTKNACATAAIFLLGRHKASPVTPDEV